MASRKNLSRPWTHSVMNVVFLLSSRAVIGLLVIVLKLRSKPQDSIQQAVLLILLLATVLNALSLLLTLYVSDSPVLASPNLLSM